jgi:hypothetical protein
MVAFPPDYKHFDSVGPPSLLLLDEPAKVYYHT